MTDLLPRRPAPALIVPTTEGESWTLADRAPRAFSMIVVYRGRHCPLCRGYLQDLDGRLDAFAERGVDVLAVSTDTAERADAARRDWQLERLPHRLRARSRHGPGVGTVHLRRRRHDLDGTGGAGAVRRARAVPRRTGRHALPRRRPVDAVRPAEPRRRASGDRLRARAPLPGAGRGRPRRLSGGRGLRPRRGRGGGRARRCSGPARGRGRARRAPPPAGGCRACAPGGRASGSAADAPRVARRPRRRP